MKTSPENKLYRRHQRVWTFCRRLCSSYLKRKFSYSCIQAPETLKAPYIVVSNHNTDLDPAFIALSFPQQMYFVASEHVYRKGFASKLLKWGFEPISKMKGYSDALTVMKMIRTLRSGKNVCVFPEGNRSFNGRTCYIADAIGKLVLTSGATLVTYKFTGGYFTSPRWAYGFRKGKMQGAIVNIYDKEKLISMGAQKITDAIRHDLQENAYLRQKQNQIRYKGKNLAEGMECALCVCPKCKEIDSIVTVRNSIYCKKCGAATDIDEYGYFLSDFKFHTVEEWDSYQEKYLVDFAKKHDDNRPLFSDTVLILRKISSDHKEELVGEGIFSMYKDRFSFKTSTGDLSVKVDEIIDMAIYGRANLVFSDAAGNHYEIKSDCKMDHLKNMRKYVIVWKFLKSKNL